MVSTSPMCRRLKCEGMPNPATNDPLDVRVLRSLKRHGLDDIPVTDLGGGVIKIDLSRTGPDDRSLAIASVRSVPGVAKVVC